MVDGRLNMIRMWRIWALLRWAICGKPGYWPWPTVEDAIETDERTWKEIDDGYLP